MAFIICNNISGTGLEQQFPHRAISGFRSNSGAIPEPSCSSHCGAAGELFKANLYSGFLLLLEHLSGHFASTLRATCQTFICSGAVPVQSGIFAPLGDGNHNAECGSLGNTAEYPLRAHSTIKSSSGAVPQQYVPLAVPVRFRSTLRNPIRRAPF